MLQDGQSSEGEPRCHDPTLGEYSGAKPVEGSPSWSSTVITFTRSERTGPGKSRDRERKRRRGVPSVVTELAAAAGEPQVIIEDLPCCRMRHRDCAPDDFIAFTRTRKVSSRGREGLWIFTNVTMIMFRS